MSQFPFPKIVHLTYKNEQEILPEWKNVINKWKTTNPTWEIKFWNDHDNELLVRTEFPWFYDTYKNFKYDIQRVDAVRCCYLFKYGGLYIDMDYEPMNNIESIFYSEKNKNTNEIYLTKNTNGLVYFNSFMASRPGCTFWIEYLKLMMKIVPKWYWTKYFYVYYTTGPFQLTKMVSKWNKVIGIINPNMIHPCEVCDIDKENVCTSMYLKRIKGQSWNTFDSTIINYFVCNKITVIMFFLAMLFLLYYYMSKDLICKYSCGKSCK